MKWRRSPTVAPLPHSGAGQQQQVRGRGEAPELLAGTAQTPQAQLPLPGRPAPAWRTRGSGALGRRAKRGRRGGSSRGPAGRMRGRGRTAGAVGPAAGLAGVASPATAWRSRSWLVAHAGTAAPGSPWALLRRESGRERPRQFVDAAVRGPPLPCAPPRAAA